MILKKGVQLAEHPFCLSIILYRLEKKLLDHRFHININML